MKKHRDRSEKPGSKLKVVLDQSRRPWFGRIVRGNNTLAEFETIARGLAALAGLVVTAEERENLEPAIKQIAGLPEKNYRLEVGLSKRERVWLKVASSLRQEATSACYSSVTLRAECSALVESRAITGDDYAEIMVSSEAGELATYDIEIRKEAGSGAWLESADGEWQSQRFQSVPFALHVLANGVEHGQVDGRDETRLRQQIYQVCPSRADYSVAVATNQNGRSGAVIETPTGLIGPFYSVPLGLQLLRPAVARGQIKASAGDALMGAIMKLAVDGGLRIEDRWDIMDKSAPSGEVAAWVQLPSGDSAKFYSVEAGLARLKQLVFRGRVPASETSRLENEIRAVGLLYAATDGDREALMAELHMVAKRYLDTARLVSDDDIAWSEGFAVLELVETQETG